MDGSGSIPKVSRKELYKRCVGIGMKTREVGVELVTMEDAGLVILDGDEVLILQVATAASLYPVVRLEVHVGLRSRPLRRQLQQLGRLTALTTQAAKGE